MVSLDNGAYRLTCITDNPPGNLKLVFDLGQIDHPIYGKTGPLCGEIPLFHPRESFPISNFFDLDKAEQSKLISQTTARYRPLLDTLDEDDLERNMYFAIMFSCTVGPHVDCFSDVFAMAAGLNALAPMIDDAGEDLELMLSDTSAASRLIIDKLDIDWKQVRNGSEQYDADQLDKLCKLIPVDERLKVVVADYVSRLRKQFPNGTPDSGKYGLQHFGLSAQAQALRYKAHEPMQLSEDTQKVIRGYDAGFGPVVHALMMLQNTKPIPKKIRKSLLFKLLDTGVLDFAGILNDLIGITKDIKKEATLENCILRSVVRDGKGLEEEFMAALKRLQNLISDIKILMCRLLEAFPEEKGLIEFINACKDAMDGQTVAYVIAAQVQFRYGSSQLKIVPA